MADGKGSPHAHSAEQMKAVLPASSLSLQTLSKSGSMVKLCMLFLRRKGTSVRQSLDSNSECNKTKQNDITIAAQSGLATVTKILTSVEGKDKVFRALFFSLKLLRAAAQCELLPVQVLIFSYEYIYVCILIGTLY
jgi:hypothetical protein